MHSCCPLLALCGSTLLPSGSGACMQIPLVAKEVCICLYCPVHAPAPYWLGFCVCLCPHSAHSSLRTPTPLPLVPMQAQPAEEQARRLKPPTARTECRLPREGACRAESPLPVGLWVPWPPGQDQHNQLGAHGFYRPGPTDSSWPGNRCLIAWMDS